LPRRSTEAAETISTCELALDILYTWRPKADVSCRFESGSHPHSGSAEQGAADIPAKMAVSFKFPLLPRILLVFFVLSPHSHTRHSKMLFGTLVTAAALLLSASVEAVP
jgi:hypothetical protein